MLRKILDYKLSLTEEGKPLHRVRPFISALDTFMYEAPINTAKGPHIRDAVDLKRWMVLVVVALIPAIFMAIWNTGLQKMVYSSGDFQLMNEYLQASTSFQNYLDFVTKDNRYLQILTLGAMAFVPVMIISYAVGGLIEGIFASIRGHEIAEGFLVTGMLYALILPPTIPYWMVAFGVAVGVLIVKEFFGGTGMNILNPAMTCRTFLFFSFPGKMSGDVWVGTNPTVVKDSLNKMNQDANLAGLDAYTQATPLGILNNVPEEVKRVHIDAIATNTLGTDVSTIEVIQRQFSKWASSFEPTATLGQLTPDQLRSFVTGPLESGGLGLANENFQAAYDYTSLHYGIGHLSDGNFFFGNMLGCLGETSTFAVLIGALFLIWTGVGSWRTMAAVIIGALGTALIFESFANFTGMDGGAWNAAKFSLPAYKHLIMGGLAFGLVFMATDPVSSPTMAASRWIYGILIGITVIVIRLVNPGYPEGTMLAVILGNVFAPIIDHYVVHNFRRKRRVKAAW